MSFGSGAGLSTRMHNIGISGRRTTVCLEDEMWESLKDVAEREGCSVSALASRIYRQKKSDDTFQLGHTHFPDAVLSRRGNRSRPCRGRARQNPVTGQAKREKAAWAAAFAALRRWT